MNPLHRQAAREVVREAGKLLDSLGEYVRQTMHANPEWTEGVKSLDAALLAYKRLDPAWDARRQQWMPDDLRVQYQEGYVPPPLTDEDVQDRVKALEQLFGADEEE